MNNNTNITFFKKKKKTQIYIIIKSDELYSSKNKLSHLHTLGHSKITFHLQKFNP